MKGWKLVPVDPTEEMREAGAVRAGTFYDSLPCSVYEAMIAAAPKPQAAVLQLETQLSENDIKTLSDYIAQIKAPPAQDERFGVAAMIMRDVCELPQDDPEDHQTICINADTLQRIIGEHLAPPAHEADPVVWMVGICRGLYTVHLQNQQEDHLWKFEREAHAETLAKGLNKYKLYTHAPSDKLRQAAEELLAKYDSAHSRHPFHLAEGLENLRAALEKKS